MVLAPGVSAVASPQQAFPDQVIRRLFQVVGEPQLGAAVQEEGAEVEAVVAQLRRLVVPGEHVMVVVPALAQGQDSHGDVLPRADGPEIKLKIA